MFNQPKETTIRRSLLNNMLFLVTLFGLVLMIATFVGAERLITNLSRVLIGQTIDRTEAEVRHFIEPIERTLRLVEGWVRSGEIDPNDPDGAANLLVPLMQSRPQLYGTLVVNSELQLLHTNRLDNEWHVMRIDGTGTAPTRAFLPDRPELGWTEMDYGMDPRDRPWYQGALEAGARELYWSHAYRFLGSGMPGITASSRVVGPDGQTWVVALDVLLEDISDFTRHFDVGYSGLILITDGQGQIIGLPNLPSFAVKSARDRAYLKRPQDLGFTLAGDAAVAFQPSVDGSVHLEPVRFTSDGRAWWGQGKWIPLNSNRELFTGVLVPERELLGDIQQIRVLMLGIILAVMAFAAYRAITMAKRYSGPIRNLADQSIRISQGDLDEPEKIVSSLLEVNHLANAHSRMRDGLTSLLKLEDDLQLARQIQQKTFPSSFPVTDHFDIAAGSLPADETGGDTFDVIGISRDGQLRIDESEPEEIYFILADVTGHGMGPALTASQVRAMFRMGARLGRPVNEIAVQLNDQLTADSHGGRFVTAWFGNLYVETDTLHTLSAGQAPILLYRSKTDQFEIMGADTPPLGILESKETKELNIVRMHPGDIVAVLSDGAMEAKAFDGQRFGQTRIEELIRVNRKESAETILFTIRDELERFLLDSVADDDQTGIVIKRR